MMTPLRILFAIGSCLSLSAHAEDSAILSGSQLYGFVTQGYIKTDYNNFYGNSQKGSFDFRELGIGVNNKINDTARISGLYLSRRAGEADDGHGRIDHLLADFTLAKSKNSTTGIKIGRNKIPFGLYNDTRDVASTRPSILLPQSIYYDHSRKFLINADGIDLYHESWDEVDYSRIHLLLEKPNGVDNPQTENFYLGANWPGSLKSGMAKGVRWLKTFNGERTKASLFAAHLPISYEPGQFDPLGKGDITTNVSWWSLSHDVTPRLQVSGEMFLTRISYKNFGPFFPDRSIFPLGYYVQGIYSISDKWEVLGRYDISYKNKHDKNGDTWNAMTGLPKHNMFAKDLTVGVNYHYSQNLMLSAEMHFVDGTAYLPTTDNPNPFETNQRWKMLATQVTYNF